MYYYYDSFGVLALTKLFTFQETWVKSVIPKAYYNLRIVYIEIFSPNYRVSHS